MQGETSLRHFEVISKLGEGSFSCVYKVQRVDDKQFYAMKKVKIGQMREKEKQNALNEVRILASISHPNIVNYKEAFFDEKSQTLCIVMELADAGDIQSKVSNHAKHATHFTEAEIWHALTQLLRGLKALHQANILHRDLKCANVFCTSQGRFKLGDLNVSKVAKRGMARTQTGTPYYTSPEVWDDKPYDSKCDLWSLGCVLYEMASLRPPFKANNLKELYNKIHRGIFENIPSFYSEDLSQIIAQCLRVNPAQRPSAWDLLRNPIILRHTSASQTAFQNNSETSKCLLLKTIMVPKNLRALKDALPGSKYQQDQAKIRRVNSANQFPRKEPAQNRPSEQRPIDPRLFNPKPSSDIRHDPRPEQRPEARLLYRNPVGPPHRNVSVDLLRKREYSRDNSIQYQRRQNNREYPRDCPPNPSKEISPAYPSSRALRIDSSKEGRQPKINSSREMRRDSSRQVLKQGEPFREGARQGDGSREEPRLPRVNSSRDKVESISNRCKQIEERVKLLMDNKQKAPRAKEHISIVRADNCQQKIALIEKKYAHYHRPARRDSFQKLSNRNSRSLQQAGGSAIQKRLPSRDDKAERAERIERVDSKRKFLYPALPPRR